MQHHVSNDKCNQWRGTGQTLVCKHKVLSVFLTLSIAFSLMLPNSQQSGKRQPHTALHQHRQWLNDHYESWLPRYTATLKTMHPVRNLMF